MYTRAIYSRDIRYRHTCDGLIAEALNVSAALQNTNSYLPFIFCSAILQVRSWLNRIGERITCWLATFAVWLSALSVVWPAFRTVWLAYKYRNLFPIVSPCPSHPPSLRSPKSSLTRLRVAPVPCSALQLVSDVRHPIVGR